MYDPDWKEIAESPGELWDLPEMKDLEDDEIEIDDESLENFSFDFSYDY
jgi:hypothetical protein